MEGRKEHEFGMEGWKEQEYWNGEFKGTVRLEWRVGRNMNIEMERLKEQKIGMEDWKEHEYWNGEIKGTGRSE